MTDDARSLEAAQRIFERECRHGRKSLSPEEVDIFHVYRFLCEFESGGLSGLLYNLSPDADDISWSEVQPFADLRRMAGVIRELGRVDLATLLDVTFDIASAGPSDFHGTWSGWLALTDPNDRFAEIDEQVTACYETLWDDLPSLTRRVA